MPTRTVPTGSVPTGAVPDTLQPGPPSTEIWLWRARRDQVREGEAWLSDRERAVLSGLRFERRRSDWLLGRWAAKRAVAAWLELEVDGALAGDREPDLDRIEIHAANDGAPEAFVDGAAGPSISLSHRAGEALVAVARRGVRLGCDLELIEPRSDAFVADYLTEAERARVSGAPMADRDLLANLLWSAKESALKLLREGLRRDTRSVEVRLADTQGAGGRPGWDGLSTVVDGDLRSAHPGGWLRDGAYVVTVVWSSGETAARSCDPQGVGRR